MRKQFLPYFIALLVALCWSVLAFGQSDRGTITGTATDSAGASVPGANVTVTNQATGTKSTAVTTSDGLYNIPTLQPGAYKVRIEKTGFKASEQTNVQVVTSATIRVDVTMTVGDISQTVEVVSGAAQLQTETSKVSTQVSNKQVDELPLVVSGAVRNAFDLALITPEAKQIGGDDSFALGGGQGGAFGITLDGVSAGTGRFGSVQWASVNTPSLDAITEFSVDTNGFKAEYGRASGGILTFTSKSGTNQYHGSAYEFLRNNAFDARRFFENKRGVLKQHDFGGSFGGPVWLPWVYNGKDKTFFFTSIEYFRNRVGASSGTFSVPTPEMFNGDFSKWVDNSGNLIPVYDPATTRTVNGVTVRDQFQGNIIQPNRISPLAKAILGFISVKPNTNAAAGTSAFVRNNFINTAGTQLDPWTKYSVKVDHNFSEKNKLSGLYNYGYHGVVPGPDGFPGLPGNASTGRLGNQRSDVYRLNWTRVIRPNMVNYFYAGGNNWRELNKSINATGGWKDKVCIKNVIDCDQNFPRLTFSDFSTWGDSAGDGSENTIYSFGDDLSFNTGRHSFKAGYLYERIHYNGFGRQGISGWVDFNRLSTSKPGDSNIATGGGNSFASFLLGEVYSGRLDSARFVSQQWRSHSLYFQDDWKINSKLTLNLGVRYEFTLPPIEANDKFSDFDPNKPNPKADGFLGALIFSGEGQGREGRRALASGYYKGIAPRFGFAYQINDKTVIRGGAAKSFGIVKTVNGSAHFAGAVLIDSPSSTNLGVTPAFKLDTGWSAYTPPPSLDPSFSNGNTIDWWAGEAARLPEEYNWTLSIQRELPKNFIFETTYNASVGVHLVSNLLNYNQVPFDALQKYGRDLLTKNINDPAVVAAGIKKPYASFSGSAAQALRRWPQYQQVVTGSAHGDKSGHSSYHAWVNKLEKRYGNGLTLQGSYVFSKIITDTDRYGIDGNALDHYRRYLEKSVGAYDVPHNFKLSYIYDLPLGKGKKYLNSGAASVVLGGWRFAGIQLYSSGNPIALGNSVSFPLFGGGNRADVTTLEKWINEPSNPDWRGATRYFNSPCTFVTCNAAGQVTQPTDRLGNSPRYNTHARNRAALTENFSLAKTFAFTEKIRMDFRWEAFNAFNRVRLATGSANVQSLTFGQVTSQLNEPRRMQFALKLYF